MNKILLNMNFLKNYLLLQNEEKLALTIKDLVQLFSSLLDSLFGHFKKCQDHFTFTNTQFVFLIYFSKNSIIIGRVCPHTIHRYK